MFISLAFDLSWSKVGISLISHFSVPYNSHHLWTSSYWSRFFFFQWYLKQTSRGLSVTCRVNITSTLPMNTYSKIISRFLANQLTTLFVCYIVRNHLEISIGINLKEDNSNVLKNEKSCRMGLNNIKFYLISKRCLVIFSCPSLPFWDKSLVV